MAQPAFDHLELNTIILKNRIAKKHCLKYYYEDNLGKKLFCSGII